MKRAMIAAARRVVLLADSSKVQPPAFCTICGVASVHEVITDDAADPSEVAALRDAGVEVRLVSAGSASGEAP